MLEETKVNKTNNTEGPNLLSKRVSAAVLGGISVRELDRRLALREIGCVRIGRRVFIPRAEIERYISANFTPAIDAKAEAARILSAS